MRWLSRPRMRLAWDYVVAGVVVAVWMAAMWCWAVIGDGWGLNG